jgi:hypothetical protein
MTEATRSKWTDRVRRWRASSLTAREFGARHGLDPRTLRWWAWKLRRSRPARPAFVEVRVPPAMPAMEPGAVEVLLRGGARLRVGAGFDPAHLRAVVAALEEPGLARRRAEAEGPEHVVEAS